MIIISRLKYILYCVIQLFLTYIKNDMIENVSPFG